MNKAPMEQLVEINSIIGDALAKLERALRMLDEHALWRCHVCGKTTCNEHDDANDERKVSQGR